MSNIQINQNQLKLDIVKKSETESDFVETGINSVKKGESSDPCCHGHGLSKVTQFLPAWVKNRCSFLNGRKVMLVTGAAVGLSALVYGLARILLSKQFGFYLKDFSSTDIVNIRERMDYCSESIKENDVFSSILQVLQEKKCSKYYSESLQPSQYQQDLKILYGHNFPALFQKTEDWQAFAQKYPRDFYYGVTYCYYEEKPGCDEAVAKGLPWAIKNKIHNVKSDSILYDCEKGQFYTDICTNIIGQTVAQPPPGFNIDVMNLDRFAHTCLDKERSGCLEIMNAMDKLFKQYGPKVLKGADEELLVTDCIKKTNSICHGLLHNSFNRVSLWKKEDIAERCIGSPRTECKEWIKKLVVNSLCEWPTAVNAFAKKCRNNQDCLDLLQNLNPILAKGDFPSEEYHNQCKSDAQASSRKVSS